MVGVLVVLLVSCVAGAPATPDTAAPASKIDSIAKDLHGTRVDARMRGWGWGWGWVGELRVVRCCFYVFWWLT